ncbi:MAG: DUF3054 domain-containing protein [Ilumatobacter sp.]|uniref:DUF3054 domain-containing protein n=1 Tax=Ilumatobacter sp. TaxID=1967498 RepID=UPI003297AA1F
MSRSSINERTPIAAAVDAGIVTAFVAIGRNNHDEDPGVIGLLSTAAPFLVGLVIGWLVTKAWDDPMPIRRGLIIWPVTVAVGMIGRRLVGDGTALSFVIVATVFLGVTLVGWRAARLAVVAKRHVV